MALHWVLLSLLLLLCDEHWEYNASCAFGHRCCSVCILYYIIIRASYSISCACTTNYTHTHIPKNNIIYIHVFTPYMRVALVISRDWTGYRARPVPKRLYMPAVASRRFITASRNNPWHDRPPPPPHRQVVGSDLGLLLRTYPIPRKHTLAHISIQTRVCVCVCV